MPTEKKGADYIVFHLNKYVVSCEEISQGNNVYSIGQRFTFFSRSEHRGWKQGLEGGSQRLQPLPDARRHQQDHRRHQQNHRQLPVCLYL